MEFFEKITTLQGRLNITRDTLGLLLDTPPTTIDGWMKKNPAKRTPPPGIAVRHVDMLLGLDGPELYDYTSGIFYRDYGRQMPLKPQRRADVNSDGAPSCGRAYDYDCVVAP